MWLISANMYSRLHNDIETTKYKKIEFDGIIWPDLKYNIMVFCNNEISNLVTLTIIVVLKLNNILICNVILLIIL